jgi:hypothetical protein
MAKEFGYKGRPRMVIEENVKVKIGNNVLNKTFKTV